MRAPRQASLPVSGALGLVVAVGAYAALRAGQVLLGREPHPLDLVLVEHSGYAWRVVAAFFAGAVVVVPARFSSRGDRGAARALAVAIPIAAAALLVQTIVAP